ncbi:nitroreductase family deazaflavin-dependent oxidoreductase [[Mycobacterium] nativiensis]|uniref:Nitroreductase family deazaflavin-dependent oxidoreductase n=1 Tax=[Mycobacterium] nativiensis TaxID=2855503 RepID=A0ABU5XXX3_9MYCO|nr:nitroreductase family deazaflavin-dependent oxidoreductase [Mycolicibacter sp. MYC340]MEB3032836.1 nitroreductase family deazaflavin-dependent oxidoreductase [Mycolicibacter sp. MYC340]
MPFPKRLARWNRVGLNRITRHVASWAPGFGVISHQGRRSGRTYETPVNVFTTATGVRVALTYGADADWVKNVVAAGGCRLRTRRRELALTDPRVVHDPSRTSVRRFERRVLGVLDVADFLDFTAQPASS